jgi:hypothetical protein
MNLRGLFAAFFAALPLALGACEQPFDLGLRPDPKPSTEGDNPSPNPPANNGPVLCDPFDPGNEVSALNGLSGELRFADPTVGPSYTSVFEYKQNAQLVNATLFLSALNVAPRNFAAGFSVGGAPPLSDGNGQPLLEYFSVHVKSNLMLDASDAEGFYQFALLADDGAVMTIVDPVTGLSSILVDNDQVHAPRLACGSRSLNLSRSSKIATQIDYFQGPRYQIALMLLWRPVATADAAIDQLCESPLSDYTALTSRGWKPVAPKNFLLQEGTNRCVQQTQ